ncbi:MAG: polyprenyl synthetase family protein [Nitriliruptoraceae bacterium]
MADVTSELRSFTGGGKRIRPALLLLGFEAGGGGALPPVEGPALALELLHTCALIHDDVIDQAATRRGRASIHHAAADRHRTAGWAGDPDAYGRAIAILIGDLAFVLADELFLAAEVPDRQLLAAFRRFTTLREEVMVGQYLDLQAATARLTERALAIEIATLKSGRYSVARPLEIGATLAGASEELVTGLRAFGDPLGRAFQLADDLLGVFGDAAETGKSTSSDLAEGKRTYLIAEAVERLEGAELARLEEALGRDDLDHETTAALRELLVASGARDATLARISTYVDEARMALDGLSLPAASRKSLSAVADYLGARSS